MKSLIKKMLWRGLRTVRGSDSVPLRVLAGPAKRTVLNLDLTQGSYWLGNYDRYVLARIPLSRYLRPGDTAWDCGAFVGFYTAIFRRLVGDSGQVIASEGSQANFAQLKKVPALNGWENVQILHQAVGPDHIHIEFAGGFGGASGPATISPRFKCTSAANTETVRCFGIDELVESGIPRPQLIKFDLEGAEEPALHNGPELFDNDRPLLLLEMHGAGAFAATARFLDVYGYWAAPASSLAKFDRVSEDRWLASLRAGSFRTGQSLLASRDISEMMLMLPMEHSDLRS
jgi:FkbM family methyltransferase